MCVSSFVWSVAALSAHKVNQYESYSKQIAYCMIRMDSYSVQKVSKWNFYCVEMLLTDTSPSSVCHAF